VYIGCIIQIIAGVEISGFLACFFGDSGAKDSMCLCIRQIRLGSQLGKVTEKLGKVRKFNGVRTLSLTL
jgi:hypothetical protein